MTQSQGKSFSKTSSLFYPEKKLSAQPSQFLFDETYSNMQRKKSFSTNPKYAYFNAIMQMKQKLSLKQQIYKNVFESQIKQVQGSLYQTKKSFYLNSQCNISIPIDNVKIQKINSNSFKMVKKPNTKQQFYQSQTNNKYGRKSNLNTNQNTSISFEMVNKPRNNKSYVQFQVNQHKKQNQPITNTKPRLDQIMAQYRRINRKSMQQKIKKSSLPKDVIEKLFMSNNLFNPNNKKKSSLF